MFSYYRFIIFYLILVIFNSCSTIQVKPSQRAFLNEDIFILKALDYEYENDIKNAILTYEYLYKNSNKAEYKIRQAELYFLSKKYELASKNLLALLEKESLQNEKAILYLISESFIYAKKPKQAIKYSERLLKLEQSQVNYLLVANAYIISKNFQSALKFLERVYSYEHNSLILDKMVSIMYLIDNDKKKAISYLESHLRLYKFDKKIADKLVLFYKESKDISGLISIYKRLYKKSPNDGYQYELINLFISKNDKKSLIKFLENANIKSSLFEQIHGYINNAKLSYNLSKTLYKKTKDLNFLAQSLMYEYEYLLEKNKIKNKNIRKIHKKFKQVLNKIPSPKYFNYIGYILIEHNVNVKTGISYVQKALISNPKSPFYLDSLAWGYYKIKKYDKAYSIMQKVISRIGLDDSEITKHWKKIKSKAKKKK